MTFVCEFCCTILMTSTAHRTQFGQVIFSTDRFSLTRFISTGTLSISYPRITWIETHQDSRTICNLNIIRMHTRTGGRDSGTHAHTHSHIYLFASGACPPVDHAQTRSVFSSFAYGLPSTQLADGWCFSVKPISYGTLGSGCTKRTGQGCSSLTLFCSPDVFGLCSPRYSLMITCFVIRCDRTRYHCPSALLVTCTYITYNEFTFPSVSNSEFC